MKWRVDLCEDKLEDLWINKTAQDVKKTQLLVGSRAVRIDVFQKVMAIATGYCLSKFCVALINESDIGETSVWPAITYNFAAAIFFAVYLTYAVPKVAKNNNSVPKVIGFFPNTLHLWCVMAPVIMGWAFRDTVIAFYNAYLTPTTDRGGVTHDRFEDGTNWIIMLGCALGYLMVVSVFTFMPCVRHFRGEGGFCCDSKEGDAKDGLKKPGNIWNLFKKSLN